MDIGYPVPAERRVAGGSSSRQDFRRFSRWILGSFWLLQFIALTLLSLADDGLLALRTMEPRAVVLIAGVALMLGLVEIVARLERRAFATRLLLTFCWSMMLCLALVGINFAVFFIVYGSENEPFVPGTYVHIALIWTWFCIAVSGALLALSYHLAARDRERGLAAMKSIASRAQLAALRYQLNPHFLFNTLNSIAALVADHDNEAAERMVENLADFLRATLELDPWEYVTLGREVELQRMYLSVEEVRFPGRLEVSVDVQPDLQGALVPALITQPLVENVIRHAVACSTDPVTLRLSASHRDGALIVTVEDDGRPKRSARKGTGCGLTNVRERLEGLFGGDHALEAERVPAGGFRVAMRLPLRRVAEAGDPAADPGGELDAAAPLASASDLGEREQ